MSGYFILATFALWLSNVCISKFSLLAYAPFLAICSLRAPLHKALWGAAIAGTCVDLFSATPPGWYALNYVLVSALLFRFHSYFFFEKPFHICLYSALFSFASTLLDILARFFFETAFCFSFKEVFVDLFIVPYLDGLYALIWFIVPLTGGKILQRYWRIWKREGLRWVQKRRNLA